MKLDYPFLQLPVSFDAALIAREIEAKWRKHQVALARVLPSLAATQARAEILRDAGADR